MLKFENIQESDILDKTSFKKCVTKLYDATGFGYNLTIEKKESVIVFNVCHKKSPIPIKIGEIEYKNEKYNIREY